MPVQTVVTLVAFRFALHLAVQFLDFRTRRDVQGCPPVFESLAGVVGTPGRHAGQRQQSRIAMDLQLGFQKLQRFLRTAGSRSGRRPSARRPFAPEAAARSLARTARRHWRGSCSRPWPYPATQPGGEPDRNLQPADGARRADNLPESCPPPRPKPCSRAGSRREIEYRIVTGAPAGREARPARPANSLYAREWGHPLRRPPAGEPAAEQA